MWMRCYNEKTLSYEADGGDVSTLNGQIFNYFLTVRLFLRWSDDRACLSDKNIAVGDVSKERQVAFFPLLDNLFFNIDIFVIN